MTRLTQACFVSPNKRVKSRLFQALIRGARPDSNSRPQAICEYIFYFLKFIFDIYILKQLKK